ncbi:MAG: ComEA family DNA-binding protein [Myxococcota bacterium]
MTPARRVGLLAFVCSLLIAGGRSALAVEEGSAAAVKLVDLNTATAAELDGLPGVGRKRADAIIAKRPFKRVTELLRVRGFGPKLFARVRDHVTVGTSPTAKERLDGLGKP